MKPEFGNLVQIEMLRQEKENEERFEKAITGDKVGVVTIEACGGCEAPLSNFERRIRTSKGILRICTECDSVIEIIFTNLLTK